MAYFWDILNVLSDLLVDSAIRTDLKAKMRKEDKSRKARKRIIFTIIHVATRLHKLTVLGKAGSSCWLLDRTNTSDIRRQA